MMNLQQVRLVDPILTSIAQGYRQPNLVGLNLFPPVEVLARGGKVIEFGKDAFKRYAARRAPGSDVRIISFGYEGKPFDLVQDALDGKIPTEHLEDARNVPGLDLGSRAVTTALAAVVLGLECEQAEIARNPVSYDDDHKITLADGDKWLSPDSDPIGDVERGMEAVRQTCGMEPNIGIFSSSAYKAFRQHPKVLERFRGLLASAVRAEQIASLFDLEQVLVGKAVYSDDTPEGAFHDVWGDDVILAYAPQKSTGYDQPSFAYTYRLKGHPMVMSPWWDGHTRSWRYPISYDRRPLLTGQVAGYLIQNAGGAVG